MCTTPGPEVGLCRLSLTFMHNAVFVKTLSGRLPLDNFSSESSHTCKFHFVCRIFVNLGFGVGLFQWLTLCWLTLWRGSINVLSNASKFRRVLYE